MLIIEGNILNQHLNLSSMMSFYYTLSQLCTWCHF